MMKKDPGVTSWQPRLKERAGPLSQELSSVHLVPVLLLLIFTCSF